MDGQRPSRQNRQTGATGKIMNATKINEMMTAAGIAGTANDWKGKRIYINLASCDKSFAGNRNYQLYYDIAAGQLISKTGKGTTSRQFDADVKSVKTLFNN